MRVCVLLVWLKSCYRKTHAINGILNIDAADVKMARAPPFCRIRAKGDKRHASG